MDAVSGIAALADPMRRALYEVVVAADGPLRREDAADRVGVAVHTAKFHLDRLVAEGLLDVEFRRLSGRTGPGAGRPSKLYHRVDREIAVSLPARQYDLLSRILANAVAESEATGEPVGAVASRVARSEGEDLGRSRPESVEPDLARVESALAATGYEPRRVAADRLELRNCPFHQAAAEQTQLVCGLNFDFVDGVRTGLGATNARPALDPGADRCCVTVSTTSPEGWGDADVPQ